MIAGFARGLRTLKWSSVVAFQDFRAVYSFRTWLFAWLLRCLCQVAVFGLLGRYLSGPDVAEYLTVGTAFLTGLASVALVIQATAWERRTGSLPLLVASPSPTSAVLAGRGVIWLADGVTVCLLALVLVPPMVADALPIAWLLRAVPMVLVTYLGMYGMCLFVSALTLGTPGARNLVSNLCTAVVALLAGVQVPLVVWPAWVRTVAQFLPITHGVSAMRSILAGSGVAGSAWLAQTAISLAWFVAAAIAFSVFLRRARAVGSIEYGE